MELLAKLLTVLGLGAVELWAAVPAGLALGLHPVTIAATAAVGAMLGALAIVALGEGVRRWLPRSHGGGGGEGRHRLMHRVWHRYGAIGLGLLAPLLTGAPLGVALGLFLGARPIRLWFWTSVGAVIWSTLLTLAGALGVAGVQKLGH